MREPQAKLHSVFKPRSEGSDNLRVERAFDSIKTIRCNVAKKKEEISTKEREVLASPGNHVPFPTHDKDASQPFSMARVRVHGDMLLCGDVCPFLCHWCLEARACGRGIRRWPPLSRFSEWTIKDLPTAPMGRTLPTSTRSFKTYHEWFEVDIPLHLACHWSTAASLISVSNHCCCCRCIAGNMR
ncbi:hypothetical protein BDN71DRAFT_534160 [Pleurotus eryngii]|uniref:Uncharacterized protein n=1 Tax=Pleurotus eryngii TaxID=5323 RepID=A0A9P6A225_PLEER|nr:hypothetical protein BDN71DRAFT_534160 [Pleurotus eryngii]